MLQGMGTTLTLTLTLTPNPNLNPNLNLNLDHDSRRLSVGSLECLGPMRHGRGVLRLDN